MKKEPKDYLFYIGLFIFAVTLILKHLCIKDNSIVDFCKGFGCALVIVGAFALIRQKKSGK